jgi:penicillin-binding protein 2
MENLGGDTMAGRMLGAYLGILAAFALLFIRTAALASDRTLSDAAAYQSTKTVLLSSSRGLVYDRNLEPLAGRDSTAAAVVFPGEASPAVLEKLLSGDSLLAAMRSRLPFLTAAKLPESEGVYFFERPVRYAQDQTAIHLIGYLDGNGAGVYGIEKAFEGLLSGAGPSVSVTYSTDAYGNLIGTPSVDAEHGDGGKGAAVVLTIDTEIQRITEAVLAEHLEKGAAVVMDVHTGDLLASASVPEFDPDNPAASLSDGNAPFLNRAFSAYAVGSTFKLAVAAAALESGFSPDYKAYCAGEVNVDGQVFHCHWTAGHGELDMATAMKYSCNPYFITLAQEVGGKKILEMARNLGFGSPCDFWDGLGAAAGTLPTEAELQNPAELASFAFGQGKLSATPVQLAALISAAANGGKAVTPRLIKGIYDADGTYRETASYEPNPVMSARTAALLREMTMGVLEEEAISASMPASGGGGGKTASAQTGQYDETGKEIIEAWFIGYFPAEEPEYAVVILAEDAESGTVDAAPLFKEIADRIGALGEK